MNIPLRKNNKNQCTGIRLVKGKNGSQQLDKWRAYITIRGKNINIGVYKTKEEAIEARRNAEYFYFGEYSPLTRKKYKYV